MAMHSDDDYMVTEEASVGYQKRTLIDHVNLHVKKGEILTLIGPNGVGKSTILKSIIRQLSLIAGTVSVDGKELSAYAPKELAKKMAIVMTERIHPERYTCYDVVATGRYPYTGKMGMLQKEDEEKIFKSERFEFSITSWKRCGRCRWKRFGIRILRGSAMDSASV